MTIGLSMIVRDEVEEVAKLLELLDPYIDEAYITITSKKREQDFYKIKNSKVRWSTFTWVDNFSKARNYNLKRIKTDYFIWLDSDDTVLNPERIPELCEYMQRNGLDGLYLPYDYMQNEAGESIAWHVRERILKTDHPWEWKGAIHESLISRGVPVLEKNEDLVVKHNKSIDAVPESAKRNHKILLKEYEKGEDPRVTHYLGLSYFMQRDYDKAIELLLEHIKTSGWDEEIYRSWCKIAEAHLLTNNIAKANAALNAAIDLLPDYPEAYYVKVDIYYREKDAKKAYEWLKTALSKPQPPTMSIIDPNKRVRAMMVGVYCLMELGRPKEAFGLLNDVKKESPLNPMAKDVADAVEYSYMEAKAIEMVEWLSMFNDEYRGDVVKLLQSLPPDMFSDPRLNSIRAKFIKPKRWKHKSIVFFCPSDVVWGADTLEEGMGGSEEAIVYLSRELAKLGWEVTIYNERDEEYKDGEVTYLPWTTLNTQDQFDVFVAWRAPEHAKGIKARKAIVDMHDAIEAHRVKVASEYVDKFFVKSKYHRSLFKDTKDSKFTVIGNGIKEDQFNENSTTT